MSQFVNVKKTDAGKKAASAAKKAKGLKGFKAAMEKQRYKGKK